MFDPHIQPGQILTNRQVMDIFHCACEGGIRYASKTGTVIIVVNTTKEGLPNRWHDGILYFAGRPEKKAPGFSGPNKRLAEFLEASGAVFLFVVEQQGQYLYRGPVAMAGQIEWNKTSENVSYPVFPVKLLSPEFKAQ